MIVAALSARRPSLMARPEWSAVGDSCLKNESSSALVLSYLLDVLAQIPELYYEQDVLVLHRKQLSATNSKEVSYLSRVRQLLDRTLNLLEYVRSKMRQWKSSHLDSIFTSLPCANILSSHPYPCMLVTHFASLADANVFNLYSSVVVLLSQLTLSLYKIIPFNELDMPEYDLVSDETSIAVLDILKSIDYFLTFSELTDPLKYGVSGQRSFYLLLPIRVAYRVLAQSTLPEHKSYRGWLEDVSSTIENGYGAWASNKNIFHVK
jgi:hypothetical protein